ncbi:MAG TPA: hypothetical protein VIY48_08505 [Candidatus Paceibacterota bacterium]
MDTPVAEKKKPGRPAKNKIPEVTAPTEKATGTEYTFPEGTNIQNISVTSMKRVSLANPEFDPFKKYKTDPKMYYRALNNRSHNITKREAEGYKLIPEAKYGDLVLGCMPKEIRQQREAYVKEKTQNQTTAAVERFKEEAERGGVETYEEQ